MSSYILPTIGFAILIFAICMAVRNRFNTSKCFSCLMLGIFFSTFFMVLPTEWISDGEDYLARSFYIFISSLDFCFDTIKGSQKIAQFETLAATGIFKAVYIGINYIIAVVAPVMTSSLIVSFFGNSGERIQYALRFSEECHVFSELNENALTLAKGIKHANKKNTIVFCNTKSADKKLTEAAKKFGGILLYKSCEALSLGCKHKKYYFYLITGDEDTNTNATLALINKHNKNTKQTVIINAFAHSGANIKVVEGTESGNVEVHFIDEIALLCNQLLYKYPLFASAKDQGNGKKLMSVMLVGGGRTGLSMLKTVVWCGQIENHHLKVRLYDKNARQTKEEFYSQCPELALPEYDIEFIETDVQHSSFNEQVIKHSSDTTYAVIAMGDDELNITIADALHSIFRKVNNFTVTPAIFARIRSAVKGKNLSDNKYLEMRNIHLFGNIETIYSEKTLFNTGLEKLALAVHIAYNEKLYVDKNTPEYKAAVRGFLTSEYNRRSSMATALHIESKLYSKKIMEAEGSSPEEIQDRLSRNEHVRWMTFMRSEGYCTTDAETMKKYAPLVKKNRDDLSKLHPCIADWNELDRLSEEYNKLGISEEPEDFKKSDMDIVKEIPKILQTAAEL